MEVATASTAEDAIFDPSAYDLPIPKIDGIKSNKLSVSFGGTLDRTNEGDLEALSEMTMLEKVTLTVSAVVVGKSFNGKPTSEEPSVGYQVRLQITGIEL